MKIIGAGFGRTGTLSLKLALEQLGFSKCYHMMELLNHADHMQMWSAAHKGEQIDWDKLFEGYTATVDWPSCNLWREQLNHFDDAVVILSRRDPDKWYASIMNTIYPSTLSAVNSDDPGLQAFGNWAMEIIWNGRFDGHMDDKDHVIGVYNQHNQAVIDEVPADRLLVYEPGDGWEPLCEFLNVPVPDVDYPHTNTTEEFLNRESS